MNSLRTLIALGVTTAALAASGLASAEPVGDQFQISEQGGETDEAFGSDIAFNGVRNEHLVVWVGSTGADVEIFAQRITQDGSRIGTAVQLSSSGDETIPYEPGGVAYDPDRDQYLVSWSTEDDDVRLRRVAGDGTPLGADTKISDIEYTDMETTQPVYDYNQKRFLVVWKAEAPVVNQQAWAQIVAGEGDLTGADIQVTTDTDGIDDAIDVAFNGTDNEFLVAFHGPIEDPSYDVGVQRLTASGDRIGSEIIVSDDGPDGYPQPPRVEWNSVRNEYLVAWAGESSDYGTDEEYEIRAQRLSNTGAELGTDDARITNLGPDGNTAFKPSRPDIAYHPEVDEYLVTFHGDDDTAPLIDEANEVFGQRVSGTGEQIGADDFRISHTLPDTDTRDAYRPRVAYDADRCDYLVVWHTEYDGTAPVLQSEIFGRRVEGPICAPRSTAAPAISGTAQEGETLSCSPGSYQFADNTTIQWLRDGQPIDGATGTTYVVQPADVGRSITCRSTATNATGSTSQTSVAVVPVAKPVVTTPPPMTPARVAVRGLTVRVRPGRDRRAPFRYRTTGRITLPVGVTQAAGCAGRVSVQIKRRRKTLSNRRVSLSKTCTYRSVVSFKARRLKRAGRLRVIVRFLGNAHLLPKRARVVRVRYR